MDLVLLGKHRVDILCIMKPLWKLASLPLRYQQTEDKSSVHIAATALNLTSLFPPPHVVDNHVSPQPHNQSSLRSSCEVVFLIWYLLLKGQLSQPRYEKVNTPPFHFVPFRPASRLRRMNGLLPATRVPSIKPAPVLTVSSLWCVSCLAVLDCLLI